MIGMNDQHILVIDDDDRLRLLLRRFLEESGFRVTDVGSAGAARQALDSLVFDVLVVDIMMPGLTGDEAVQQYRAWEREHRCGKTPLRVYACTGNVTSTDVAAYVAAGFDGCVSKPICARRPHGPKPSAHTPRTHRRQAGLRLWSASPTEPSASRT